MKIPKYSFSSKFPTYSEIITENQISSTRFYYRNVWEKAQICKYPFEMVYGFESLLQKH